MKKTLCFFNAILVLLSVVACANSSGGEFSNVLSSDIDELSDYSEQSFFTEESLSVDLSESSADHASSEFSLESFEESSEDSDTVSSEESSVDTTVGSRFSVLSPKVAFNKVWENGKMELFNTEFRMSDELLNKLQKCLTSFSNNQSIALIELETNMAFCFSKDTKIGTASAIKAPLALFVSKCIDDGVISWDTTKTYEWWHYQANSTGVIQNSPYGTAFTVESLMDNMIRISDNQAYLMLKELVGADNFETMMSALGSTRIIPVGGNWGEITAWEMASTWREIYYYSKYNGNGEQLFDRFMHAMYNYIWRAIPQYEAAHKSGWSGRAYNDAGVVFADGHQYVLVVLLGRNGLEDNSCQYQFSTVTQLLAELMVEYNAYIEAGTAN